MDCYCGNSFGSYGTASSVPGRSCNVTCPNQQTEMCGGLSANLVSKANCPSMRGLFFPDIIMS